MCEYQRTKGWKPFQDNRGLNKDKERLQKKVRELEVHNQNKKLSN